MILPPVIISACLAGLRTRFDGQTRPHPLLSKLAARYVLVPVCPEILGGLGIPRPRCNFSGGDGHGVLAGTARVLDESGIDRTDNFIRGAEETRSLIELVQPHLIVLKEGSPSCGLRRVDIEGCKQPGNGVTAAMLAALGIPLITEDHPLP